ncbi:MAG: AEC family transporter [Chitinophagaceae bacterium]|nr:AEC family transporter [Chitinophagaceae bacterium]
MTNFILIGLCILTGFLLRRSGTLPQDTYKGVNAWIINIALPAVSFKYLPHIQWNSSMLLPVLMPVIIWLCAWLYVKIYASQNVISRQTAAALRLSTGLSNTSFVGFPLTVAYFGEQELSTAVICDQVTFMILATAGILLAVNASGSSNPSLTSIIKKIISFPPFIACIAALVIPVFVDISPLDNVFDKLAGTIGPLALFSIGLQIKFTGWKDEVKHIGYALLFKLILAPLIILIIILLTGTKNNIAQVTVFESAMPSFLTASIVAAQYNLNPKLSSLITGISIVLSFLTTAIWYQAIVHFIAR